MLLALNMYGLIVPTRRQLLIAQLTIELVMFVVGHCFILIRIKKFDILKFDITIQNKERPNVPYQMLLCVKNNNTGLFTLYK